MEEVDLSKPFSVDIFSDDGPIDQSPWLCIGEFNRLDNKLHIQPIYRYLLQLRIA